MKTLDEYRAELAPEDGAPAWVRSLDGFPRQMLEGKVDESYDRLVMLREEFIDHMGMNADEVEMLDLLIEGGRVLGMGLFSIAHDDCLRDLEAGERPANPTLKMDGGHP